MTEHPIEPGSMVRVLQPTVDLYDSKRTYPEGFEFEVEMFEKDYGEHEGDKDFIQGDYYMGNANGGYSNVAVPADSVRMVMSAEEMANRQGPTLAQLTEWVADSLGDIADSGTVHSSDRNDAEGTVEFFGTMENGLEFTFSVKITDWGVVDA